MKYVSETSQSEIFLDFHVTNIGRYKVLRYRTFDEFKRQSLIENFMQKCLCSFVTVLNNMYYE